MVIRWSNIRKTMMTMMRKSGKEKITFAILGIIIVVLVVAIVFGVVKLVGAGSGDTKKVPQLNEQMKEDMQKIQDRDEKDTEESEDASVADETVKEPETVTPEVTATPEPSRNDCSTDTAGHAGTDSGSCGSGTA